jgi:glycosyltransferase involved in cell wall biosynthesis
MQFRVELVAPGKFDSSTGIRRYTYSLYSHLANYISIEIKQLHTLPLARRISWMQHLPVGIEGHSKKSIVHFTKIMGCALMLWRPFHPAVATVHDLGAFEHPKEWEMLDPLARQLLRLSLMGLKRVDLIIAVSDFTRQSLINHLGMAPDRVQTIYSGIDLNRFHAVPDARRNLVAKYPRLASHSGPWLLYVGSELPRKNLPFLFEVLARIKTIHPQVLLLKVGSSGGDRFHEWTLAELRRLQAQNSVEFFDHVSDDQLPLFYSSADVYIHASKLEGFGFPVLEAMACGTPVVCSAAGALEEITGGSAIIGSPDDAGSFAAKVLAFIQNQHLAHKMAAKGRRHAQLYSWERTARNVIECYSHLNKSFRKYEDHKEFSYPR